MTVTNEIRRQVMSLAWGLYRSALGTVDARTLAARKRTSPEP